MSRGGVRFIQNALGGRPFVPEHLLLKTTYQARTGPPPAQLAAKAGALNGAS